MPDSNDRSTQDAYDTVPYPGVAYPDTHPDRLAVMALLHGLSPAPVAHCRVLEVGCNEAANLIPMAYAIPTSQFVGFDLAAQPIARGQQRIRELGLANISLFQANLMDLDDSLGQFDYIIAHGIYAWVPDPVRDALLALCSRLLTPNGVAFISYNALPGGHLRNLVRDTLQLPTPTSDDPQRSVAQALEFLQFILESRPQGDPYRILLEHEAKKVQQRNPHVVFHDELCPEQRPISFTDFVAHAAAHQLQYLSESVLPPPNDPCFQPHIATTARSLANGDPIAEEQILDFARMRVYRETLLCHTHQPISTGLSLDSLPKLRLASQATSTTGEAANTRVFTLPGGIRIETQHPATILLMNHLIEAWPVSVPFPQVAALMAESQIPTNAEFVTLLMRLVVSRMVDLHAWAAPISTQIGTHPTASATSRQEAATQTRAATLLHSSLSLEDPLVRQLLRLLDGTRDRAHLLQSLQEQSPEIDAATLAQGIEPTLQLLHRSGVLLAEPPTKK